MDNPTYMPPGGAEARGRQMATLGKLAQEKLIDPAIGKLLDDLPPHTKKPLRFDDASLIRVSQHAFSKP